MFLTRTYLNSRRRGAQKLLGSPQAMHAAILSGFPPGVEIGRPLWRVDRDDKLRPTLYILSETTPDLTHMEEQAAWPSHPSTDSTSYAPLLRSLAVGQTWTFRLTANPTHRADINGVSKVLGHVTVTQQIGWLTDRQATMGISLGSQDSPTFTLTGREVRQFRRAGSPVTLSTATFEGLLRVENPLLLGEALTRGIGRAKAYGCGLMTLARP